LSRPNARDDAKAGTAFTYLFTTVHGYPVPTITTSSPLPGGVTFTDNGNGTATLGGTPNPNTGGVYPITITATNGVGSPVTKAFTLTVDQLPVITSASSDVITSGAAMSPFTVTDAGYPFPTLRATGLPLGLRLTDNLNATATISGSPDAKDAGSYAVTITASNRDGAATQTFTLTIAP
jgi:hypothetical protein